MQSGSSLIFIIVILALFYLLMFLPQRRNQKRRAEMIRKLSPGAEVMTTAGIFGKVAEVGEERITVQVAPNVAIQMVPQAIANVVKEAPQAMTANAEQRDDDGEDESSSDDK
ncbi:MAG: preprotein translocase subunit YajC [Alicyclobacillus herbarius]|uniref:preprotein translocase subunit YajC n=1 Tax=Alicyclobacillus herbarius TaxID=122960 RepID=UPI0023560930|nr:preprotein translocase subunit YajC [Alicyclobacillus herbarius]MCL6632321.1 preprotein translocase subunit YajC [Alicyclobacillus herbarius]